MSGGDGTGRNATARVATSFTCASERRRDGGRKLVAGDGVGRGGEGEGERADGVDHGPHVLGGAARGLFAEVVPPPLLVEQASPELVECGGQRPTTGPPLQHAARQGGEVVPVRVAVVGERRSPTPPPTIRPRRGTSGDVELGVGDGRRGVVAGRSVVRVGPPQCRLGPIGPGAGVRRDDREDGLCRGRPGRKAAACRGPEDEEGADRSAHRRGAVATQRTREQRHPNSYRHSWPGVEPAHARCPRFPVSRAQRPPIDRGERRPDSGSGRPRSPGNGRGDR